MCKVLTSMKSLSQMKSSNQIYSFYSGVLRTLKIYTKAGDQGTSSLIGDVRKSKDEQIFHLLGDIDELNSYLGICHSISINKKLRESIDEIQNHLYHISSYIASQGNVKYLPDAKFEEKLETKIDTMVQKLPTLKKFIHMGGCPEAAHLQYARSLCRRLERTYVNFSKNEVNTNKDLLRFFNRLSDFLFTCARYANYKNSVEDVQSK